MLLTGRIMMKDSKQLDKLKEEAEALALATARVLKTFAIEIETFQQRRLRLQEDEAKILQDQQAQQARILAAQEKLNHLLHQANAEEEKYEAAAKSLLPSSPFVTADLETKLLSRTNTDRIALLEFHFKILKKFFDEKLKNHSFLQARRDELQQLFNLRTNTIIAAEAYKKLTTVSLRPGKDELSSEQAANEFMGYLQTLNTCGLLANSVESLPASTVNQSLSTFFRQNPKFSIEVYHRRGETADKTIQDSLQQLSKLSSDDSTDAVKAQVTRLERTKPVQDNVSGLKQYAASLSNAVQTLEATKKSVVSEGRLLEVRKEMASLKLETKTLNLPDLHEQLKREVDQAFSDYENAMGKKTGLERFLHTEAGLTDARNFKEKITQSTNLLESLQNMADFLTTKICMRDNSFPTHLLKIILSSRGIINSIISAQPQLAGPAAILETLKKNSGWRNIFSTSDERTYIRNQTAAMLVDIVQKASPPLITAGLTALAYATGHSLVADMGLVATSGVSSKGLLNAFCCLFKRGTPKSSPLQTDLKKRYSFSQ
jgi:hypothetical protein